MEQLRAREVSMKVRGMTCADCEGHVVEALIGAGAQEVTANFRRGEAHFHLPAGADHEVLLQAIRRVGYEPGEMEYLDDDTSTRTPVLDRQGQYDLVIIGSGGAAFSAAIQARRHGARVVMIERGTMGGTCVNVGCVPSKTLLRASEIYFHARNNPFAGLPISVGPVDMGLLVGQKGELVAELRREKYESLVEAYGFDVIHGEAQFIDEGSIRVGEQVVAGKAFLIATGASPSIPDIPGLKEVEFLTSTTALELKSLPKSLAVIGSGYIALELGQLYRHLGSQVTLIQRSERILKEYDPEISAVMTRALAQQGVELITGVRYERIEGDRLGKRVFIEVDGQKRVIEAEQLLVATGRSPNTAALALDKAGVRVGRRGEVIVDERLRTSNPRIFAAGDVTMGPQFVYVAAYAGALAADNALGTADRKIDLRTVPAVTFTNPSIATVGLTENEAKAAGFEVKTSILPLEAVPRAIVNRETTGVFKLVADVATGRLLGAHVVAENAGDVIYAATLAIKFGLTIRDLKETLAPYLTMAEGLKLAALTFDTDVSKLSCCAG